MPKADISDENDPDQVDMLDLLNLKRDGFGQPYENKSVTFQIKNGEREHVGD